MITAASVIASFSDLSIAPSPEVDFFVPKLNAVAALSPCGKNSVNWHS